ncbi:MAG: YlxR family protein [Actinomycetes bacterium]|nr:YlxR family protein [Actinomycetes bacterium]
MPRPERSCVACKAKADKRELLRFVRLPEKSGGDVLLDASGKAAGRGAYVCADATCMAAALKRGRLKAALRTSWDAGYDDVLTGQFEAYLRARENASDTTTVRQGE